MLCNTKFYEICTRKCNKERLLQVLERVSCDFILYDKCQSLYHLVKYMNNKSHLNVKFSKAKKPGFGHFAVFYMTLHQVTLHVCICNSYITQETGRVM